MHILYLHQYFVPPDGSGGTRSYEMARRFVTAGHRVTLVTSTAFFPKHYTFPSPVSRLGFDGIDVVALHVPYSNHMSYAQRIRAFVSFAARSALIAARAERPDVILATSTPLTIALPGLLAKAWHRRPMVFEVRDLWPELPIAMGALNNPVARAAAHVLEKAAYRSSDEVVALSPGMKEGVVRAGYPDRRVTVVPNSCDVEQFRNPAPVDLELPFDPDAGPVVTYAGTLGAINGVDYLVEVAENATLVAPSIRFVIAGDGAMRQKLLEKATATGVLGKNLWMIPPVPKKAVPTLLHRTTVATSLFIDLPPMWNNSANKFFDALAAGRPIMINYGGWQAELLKRSGAGLVVPPKSPAAAALQLRAFTEHKGRLQAAGAAAAALADGPFARDRLADELLAVLTRAVTERQ
jgi:glycosyltransferase involved in cell wall biosynthesis